MMLSAPFDKHRLLRWLTQLFTTPKVIVYDNGQRWHLEKDACRGVQSRPCEELPTSPFSAVIVPSRVSVFPSAFPVAVSADVLDLHIADRLQQNGFSLLESSVSRTVQLGKTDAKYLTLAVPAEDIAAVYADAERHRVLPHLRAVFSVEDCIATALSAITDAPVLVYLRMSTSRLIVVQQANVFASTEVLQLTETTAFAQQLEEAASALRTAFLAQTGIAIERYEMLTTEAAETRDCIEESLRTALPAASALSNQQTTETSSRHAALLSDGARQCPMSRSLLGANWTGFRQRTRYLKLSVGLLAVALILLSVSVTRQSKTLQRQQDQFQATLTDYKATNVRLTERLPDEDTLQKARMRQAYAVAALNQPDFHRLLERIQKTMSRSANLVSFSFQRDASSTKAPTTTTELDPRLHAALTANSHFDVVYRLDGELASVTEAAHVIQGKYAEEYPLLASEFTFDTLQNTGTLRLRYQYATPLRITSDDATPKPVLSTFRTEQRKTVQE